MPETVAACPLCGNPESSVFDQRNFRDQRVTNLLCQVCGLVYQSPRMTEQESATFYEREYRRMYQGQEGPDPKDLSIQKGRAGALLDFTRQTGLEISRHLDIGCSAGLALSIFKEAYHCQSVGVEPGEAYRKYAHALGFTVYPTLEELHAAEEERFDLISLAHVLEHLPDPVAYLSDLRKNLLTENGRLLIEVPNLYAHDCFEVAHLVSYSAHTLVQTLQKAGFQLTASRKHGLPRSKTLPLYITILAQSDANFTRAVASAVIPERSVKLKRQGGMLWRNFLTRLAPHTTWITPGQES